MNDLRCILVGVDLSPGSTAALVEAARLAIGDGAVLHVLHVIQDLVLAELADATAIAPDALEQQAIDDARGAIDALLADIDTPDDVRVEVVSGTPLKVLLDRIDTLAPDLVVLGLTGMGGARGSAGTFAAGTVRKSPRPVLLVHEGPDTAPATIVAGLDFSPAARRALDLAAGMAVRIGAALHVVHVYHGPWHRLRYRAPVTTTDPAFRQQYVDRLQGLVDDEVKRVASECPGLDARAVLVDRPGYGAGLVEYARGVEADLIVLGTAGRTNLRYLLLGSTAERVLRDLSCSVLTVPPSRGGA